MRQFRRVLITGATGAGARCLIEYLQKEQQHVKIDGTARRSTSRKPISGVTLYEVDVLDCGSIIRCLCKCQPDVIFHFASNPDKGWDVPLATVVGKAAGACNLFEAVLHTRESLDPVIVNISSSEIYGDIRPEEIPIKENCPKRPLSPYGVGKLAQDALASVYHKAYGLSIVTTRAFSYNNFYRTNLFTSDFARQIARIEQGKQSVLRHGNLDSLRALCDARDIAEAHWLAATKCAVGEAYNIGSEQKVTVGEVLQTLCSFADKPISCEPDPSLMRPVDVTLQIPDCSKFKKETGWQPKFDLEWSLENLLNHWRKEVAKE